MKKGSTILVIDDNEDFRKLLAEAITMWGYNAAEAVDGEQALSIIQQFSPDLVICDLDMPNMNGLEFTKRVKEINPKFPVIMVTAFAKFYTPEEINESHPDEFLQKPVHMDKLLEIIQRI
ncbi:MAG: response regulator receiver protein [Bacteroidetes bacterium]|jgi:CheY-like chemotaxis protein|nr:response regulator receiver protein [Bacteroidota bacterium]